MTGKRKSWVEVIGIASLNKCLVEFAGVDISARQHGVVNQRQRFDFRSSLQLFYQVVSVSSCAYMSQRISDVRVSNVGVELERLFEFTFRFVPLPIVDRK